MSTEVNSIQDQHPVDLYPAQIAYLAGLKGYTGVAEEPRLKEVLDTVAWIQRRVSDRNLVNALAQVAEAVKGLEGRIHPQSITMWDEQGWIFVETTANRGQEGSGVWVDCQGHEQHGPTG